MVSRGTLEKMDSDSRLVRYSRLFARLDSQILGTIEQEQNNAHSQLGQDLLALALSDCKRDGFFVEFGATDGLYLSNTALLEKRFGWTGILAEPSRKWQNKLQHNRSSTIIQDAMWSESGVEMDFRESLIGELSTLSNFVASDNHKSLRFGRTYRVSTRTLSEVLREHSAPKHIDFLSVDTEGSEYEALLGVDLNEFSFGLICVEHNFGPSREQVELLLTGHGYIQILESISDFDAWFVHPEVLSRTKYLR